MFLIDINLGKMKYDKKQYRIKYYKKYYKKWT